LTPAAVRKQIAARRPDQIYLLLGDDDIEQAEVAAGFTQLVDEGLDAFNVERIHAGEMTTGDKLAAGVASVVAAARTLPMMSDWRVVIVRQAEQMLVPRRESEAAARALQELEAYIQSPAAQTVLVLVAASVDRRSRLFKLLGRQATLVDCGILENAADAEAWVQQRVKSARSSIDAAAARLLATRAGTDLKRLRGEIERLLLYTMGRPSITVDDVKEMAGPTVLQDDWALTTAIEQGRAAEALRQLALAMDAGAASEKVLGQLAWLVRSKFPAIAPGHLASAVDAIFRADLDLKRSVGAPRMLLERLVVELADRRQPAAARRVARRDL
jgi:DNA polymerase III delta subunit